MNAAQPKTRLYVTDALHDATLLELTGDQAHYLAQVMRIKEGQYVGVFNGKDGEWLARVDAVAKKRVSLSVLRHLRHQSSVPDIWLVFAPIKFGRIDYLAEKATELGASALMPVQTTRTIVSRINEERMHSNMVQAAEQSERLDVPLLKPYIKLSRCLDEWPEERHLIYCDETGGGVAANVLFEMINKKTPLAVLIGPEGGFTPEELTRLREMKCAHAMTLGPRVLRADTAALAALACLQLMAGDWQQTPSFRNQA